MADENDNKPLGGSDYNSFNDYAVHPITSDGRTSPRVEEPEPEDILWFKLPPEAIPHKERIRACLLNYLEGYITGLENAPSFTNYLEGYITGLENTPSFTNDKEKT